jgi:hypothetical protein
MGDNLGPNGLSRGCKVFCSRSKYQIVVHEACEPNALVDLLDAELLASQHDGDVDSLAMQAEAATAVTRISRSWKG